MDRMKVDQEWVDIEIIKRKRKTVEIQIKNGYFVRVLVPEKLSKKKLEAILEEREDWIKEKIKLLRLKPPVAELENTMGFDQSILLFGEPTYLVYEKSNQKDTGSKGKLLKQGDLLTYIGASMPSTHELENILEQYYRTEAKCFIESKINHYTTLLGAKVNQIRVKEQKHRWGSCSSLRNLNFNWRCAKMPPWVFEYVIAHEVCHLIHMNHSKAFWNLLNEVYPEAFSARQWLKKHGRLLLL